MKLKIIFISLIIILSQDIFPQNITNTLGSSGTFTIKDGTGNYFTLSQVTGQVNILKSLRLENTTNGEIGVLFKGTSRFINPLVG